MTEPSSSPNLPKDNYYEWYMTIVGIAGQSMHYIQASKIFQTQSAGDISLLSYIICLFLLINWLIYGWRRRAKAMIYAESIGIIGVLGVLSGKFLYG